MLIWMQRRVWLSFLHLQSNWTSDHQEDISAAVPCSWGIHLIKDSSRRVNTLFYKQFPWMIFFEWMVDILKTRISWNSRMCNVGISIKMRPYIYIKWCAMYERQNTVMWNSKVLLIKFLPIDAYTWSCTAGSLALSTNRQGLTISSFKVYCGCLDDWPCVRKPSISGKNPHLI